MINGIGTRRVLFESRFGVLICVENVMGEMEGAREGEREIKEFFFVVCMICGIQIYGMFVLYIFMYSSMRFEWVYIQ